MMPNRISKISLFLLLLISCTSHTNEQEAGEHKETSTEVSKGEDNIPVNNYNYLKFEGDSVAILPFEIKVDLSPKAKSMLLKDKESIIIDAYFTGEPEDSTLFTEDGQFYVASAEKEIAYDQVARFDHIKFSKKIFEQLSDKNIFLNVNAYSGRKSSPDNLLNCSIFSDSISNVVNKRLTISCKLITGDQ